MPDDHSEVVPLLPIPNRTVKRFSADDSAGSRVKVGHRQALTAPISPAPQRLGFLAFGRARIKAPKLSSRLYAFWQFSAENFANIGLRQSVSKFDVHRPFVPINWSWQSTGPRLRSRTGPLLTTNTLTASPCSSSRIATAAPYSITPRHSKIARSHSLAC